jgi:hypothetical protein
MDIEVTIIFSTDDPLSQAAGRKFWSHESTQRFHREAASRYRWEQSGDADTLTDAIAGAGKFVRLVAFEDGTEADVEAVTGTRVR